MGAIYPAKALLQSLIPGNKSVWVFPSENPATPCGPAQLLPAALTADGERAGIDGCHLAHVAPHVRQPGGHGRRDGRHDRRHASAQRDGSGATLRDLSPSYLQEAAEKVSAFGKAEVKEPTKSERKQQPELMEAPEKAEAFTPIPTLPGNRKSCEVIEEL